MFYFMNVGTGSLSVLSFLCLKKLFSCLKMQFLIFYFYVEYQQEYCKRMFDARSVVFMILNSLVSLQCFTHYIEYLYKIMVLSSITAGSPENNVFSAFIKYHTQLRTIMV